MRRNSKQKHQNKTKQNAYQKRFVTTTTTKTGVDFFFFLTLRGCYVKLHDYQLKKLR